MPHGFGTRQIKHFASSCPGLNIEEYDVYNRVKAIQNKEKDEQKKRQDVEAQRAAPHCVLRKFVVKLLLHALLLKKCLRLMLHMQQGVLWMCLPLWPFLDLLLVQPVTPSQMLCIQYCPWAP